MTQPVLPRRLTLSLALLLAVVATGCVGYVLLERYSWFDALYETVTTITTIGGGEVRPLDAAGKVWTMLVVAVGFVAFTDALITLVGFVIEGHLQHAYTERRAAQRIARMREHFILCGFGRVGREIAVEFAAEHIPFVVVDQNESSLAAAGAAGYAVLRGNAAQLETLKAAGIEHARGLVTAVDSDADNVYVTLTARVLRPDLFIVARANASDAEPRLRLAGANRVASPYVIGGRRLASLATRPTAVEFVDTVLSATNAQLVLEDCTLAPGSPWVGALLGSLMEMAGEAVVLALKRSGRMHFRPATDTMLEEGDELVFAGPAETIHALEGTLNRSAS